MKIDLKLLIETNQYKSSKLCRKISKKLTKAAIKLGGIGPVAKRAAGIMIFLIWY
jgi:hypothetical protein